MHFNVIITAVFVVNLFILALGEDEADDCWLLQKLKALIRLVQFSAHEKCKITNLDNVHGIKNAIFYVITQDCRFYAWRNGHIPRHNEVGLNGSKHIVQTHSEKKVNRLGPFITQKGLSKKCATSSGAFIFGHREGEGRPELVFMTPYDTDYYVLLRILVEEYLETTTHTHKNLISMFEESGIMVNTSKKISTCSFYKEELQCFWLKDESQLYVIKFKKFEHKHTQKDEYRLYDENFIATFQNRRMVNQMAALYESGTVASVFMYDSLTDEWLYRWNDAERTASNTKIVHLNKIPKMENHLASMTVLDRATMILTKCTTLECQYFWASIQTESETPSLCLFLSKIHTLSGVITDVRLPEVIPDPATQIANAFMLFWTFAQYPYWPVVLLVVVSVITFLIVLCCAFIYESFGIKRRLIIEKFMDTKYAQIFWPYNGDIISLTLSDIETGTATANRALAPDKLDNAQTLQRVQSLTSYNTKPLQSPPITSRLLFTEEDNKTASSLRKSSPITTIPKKDYSTMKSSRPDFVNVRYATHHPPVNQRKALDARNSRITPVIPEVEFSSATLKDKKKAQDDDALLSVKVEPLKNNQEMVDASYTPATLKSRNQKASNVERRPKTLHDTDIDRTQRSVRHTKAGISSPASREPSIKKVSKVFREPEAIIEPKRPQSKLKPLQPMKQLKNLSSTQASTTNKRNELQFQTDVKPQSKKLYPPKKKSKNSTTFSHSSGAQLKP